MTNLLTYIFLFLFSFFSFRFNVDLTKPNELMNVIYHETTNFEEHNRKEQNAKNRGETGAGIFSLKNFGNENTNGMSKTEWMKENNLTIGSTGSLSLLNDVNNSQIGNGEGASSILGTVAVAGKVGLWAWSTYIAGKSAESIGSNVASWENGPDENGLYMTEYGSKVSGNALLYSTSKNSLGLITSIGTAGGSNLISGLGFTSIGATGLMEDGFIYSQGKNSAGYYENLSGMYMTGTDLAIDSASNMISFGLGAYQVNKSINESINKTFDSGFIDFGDTLPKEPLPTYKIINNEVVNNIRSGTALSKSQPGSNFDKYHGFNDVIDNYASYAKKFDHINNDGTHLNLYQIEGSLSGKDGIFEWLVSPDPQKGVVHRLFIENGKVTGKPNIFK